MNADLERDLGAWTRGELDRERLLSMHGATAMGSVALHERLVGAAAAVAIPDADAGWAALAARLETPAPVVPLRRNARRPRTITVLVAAALVLAATAFAAVWRSTDHVAPTAPPASSFRQGSTGGSSVFGSSDRRLVPPPIPNASTTSHPRGTGPGTGGSGTEGSGTGGGSGGSISTDDPRDRDHGTGNDGSHDDQGSGNNGGTGSLPPDSHGKGH